MKKTIVASLLCLLIASPLAADTTAGVVREKGQPTESSHGVTECLVETVAGTAGGTLLGAALGGITAIILAPATGGTTLLLIPGFIGAGAKGGAIWGGAAGVGTCAYNEIAD